MRFLVHALPAESPVVAIVLLLLLGTMGCEPRVHPGETIGVFQVTGSLDENGCGAAVPALDPISFEVEVRDDYGRGIWVRGDGPIQTGVQLPDGAYRFRTGTTIPVIAPQPGYRGCSLQQVELIEVHVEAVTQSLEDGDDKENDDALTTAEAPQRAMELRGINEIQYTPTSTSDCSPLPVVNGGPWAALPCTVRYTLFGDGVGPVPTDEADAGSEADGSHPEG